MKIKYLKFKNWLLATMLGVLGLSSCHSQKEISDERPLRPRRHDANHGVMLLYGVPPSDYEEKAKVEEQPEKPSVQEEVGQVMAMYGVPTAKFKVKGRVVDEQGRPVKGMRVTLMSSDVDADGVRNPQNEFYRGYVQRASDTTDAAGSFDCTTTDRPWEKQQLMVLDVDGESNGNYMEQVISVSFPEPQGKGKGFDMGTTEQEVTVKVKRK